MMEKVSEVLERLKKDELKNINILNFMENNSILSVETIGKSVLLRGKSDRIWVYISSSSKDELITLKNSLDKRDKCFGAIEEWMLPILLEDKELVWDLSMAQYYLPEDIVLPKFEYKMTSLSVEDARIVYKNSTYKDVISMEYIKDRIQLGISVGLYEKNQLVAWGITQDDDGIGFLHVLQEYRKKGYGYNITLSLSEQLRIMGKLPFTYIEEDNAKSINLVLKLGFKKDKKIHWFQKK